MACVFKHSEPDFDLREENSFQVDAERAESTPVDLFIKDTAHFGLTWNQITESRNGFRNPFYLIR